MGSIDSLNYARTRVELNGDWERYIHDKFVDIIQVPSSLHPLGAYRLQRNFLLSRVVTGRRAILHFDAINYYGRISVNGHDLGTTIPYLPREFDFTQYAQEGKNTVAVKIADATPLGDGAGKDEVAFGLSSGWEGYGGIIRDAYVEIRGDTFVDNVRLAYQLSGDYDSASCRAKVYVSSAAGGSGECELVLFWRQTQVARASKNMSFVAGPTEVELGFVVQEIALWSPEDPNLYELRARVKTAAGEDQWSCKTGLT